MMHICKVVIIQARILSGSSIDIFRLCSVNLSLRRQTAGQVSRGSYRWEQPWGDLNLLRGHDDFVHSESIFHVPRTQGIRENLQIRQRVWRRKLVSRKEYL